MTNIAVDAGPLVALFDRGDAHHAVALSFFQAVRADFSTNVAVLTEVAHLLSFSRAAARDAIGWVSSTFDIDRETASDLPRILALMTKYDELPADFADASLVAMCERRGIERVATFDSDFDVYRLVSGRALRNVFAGGSEPTP